MRPPPMMVLEMMMGHWVGQILGTVAELGVADQLAGGPRTSDELAAALHADPDALHRLLRAAASVGLLIQQERSFALTPVGDCLRADSPAGLRDLVVSQLAPGHWLPWGRLAEAVRTGQPQAEPALGMEPWTYYARNPGEGTAYARAMARASKIAGRELTAAHDFSAHPIIVDVGGGQGGLLAAVLHATPGSRGVLFDRPDVIAGAAEELPRHGLGDRLTAQAGDFFQAVPPADAYLLKSILHDWDDERSRAILRTIARAARPTSKLYVVELVLGESPMANLSDLNVLVRLGGRERTRDEYAALLGSAGWHLEQAIPTPGALGLLQAAPA
jgi:hypothetical protein